MSDIGYKNYPKLRLGATLSAWNGDNYNHGDCFNYGSVGGCDDCCPALRNGKCKCSEENKDIILNDEELIHLYPNLSRSPKD